MISEGPVNCPYGQASCPFRFWWVVSLFALMARLSTIPKPHCFARNSNSFPA